MNPIASFEKHPSPQKLEALVEARHVTRELGTEVKTTILRGIDLVIGRGEFVALTGASGSGKSTLLYLLGTLDRPTSGEVFIDGIDVGEADDDERARLRGNKLGFVFQFHFLLPEFSVLENVALPMLRLGRRRPSEAWDRARSVLASLGLEDHAKKRPGQLSGGQQQRVSIARAIANDPELILADEPTGNLDSKNGLVVMDIFEKLVTKEKKTVIMVTHERSFAERAGRRIELSDGQIASDSKMEPSSVR